MTWTIVVAYCIIDDLLNLLGHRDDPQSKTPASVVLTVWILAALEQGSRTMPGAGVVRLRPLPQPLQPQAPHAELPHPPAALWQRLGSAGH